ncbi:MAG TPA: hypothetical protein VFF28_08115, partial [Candidatus Nanoarchaeia archaeon]|nr:hypothetical protein [Candidatus Nanoarchaeia archaeon]
EITNLTYLTYIGVNKAQNISVTVSTYPSVRTINMKINSTALSADSSSSQGLLYQYNYTFIPTEEADFLINLTVINADYLSSARTAIFHARQEEVLTLTASNILNITLQDIVTNSIIAQGGRNLTVSVPLGKYNIKVDANNTEITLVNATINRSMSILEFSDIEDTLSAPADRTNIDQIQVNSSAAFARVDFVYNYSNLTGSITNEDNLEVFKCSNHTNCTWAELSASTDTVSNLISFSTTNLSIFAVVESIRTQTVTTPSAGGGGGGGGGGAIKEVTKVASMELSSIPPSIIYPKDQINIPVYIRNTGELPLEDITLNASTNATDITLAFSEDELGRMLPGETQKATLIITSHSEAGRKEIVVTATSKNPTVKSTMKIYIDLLEKNVEIAREIRDRIVFAYDLLKENPECLELQELVDKASIALKESNFQKAQNILEAAINSCRDLVSTRVEQPTPELPSPRLKREFYIPVISLISVLALIIFFAGKYSIGRIRKTRSKPYTSPRRTFTNVRPKTSMKRRHFFSDEKKVRGLWKR